MKLIFYNNFNLPLKLVEIENCESLTVSQSSVFLLLNLGFTSAILRLCVNFERVPNKRDPKLILFSRVALAKYVVFAVCVNTRYVARLC